MAESARLRVVNPFSGAQAAPELGVVGGGSYVIGRSLAKAVAEWVKR